MTELNIILASMIKNEEKTICRMLDSINNVATHICIVDTGSTDNTIKVIKEWNDIHKNIPLMIYSTEFIDFGSTRTHTMHVAKQWAKDLNLCLDNTYLLLLDADMILENHGFDRHVHDISKFDNYKVIQYNGALSYPNVRLVRASKANKYIMRTHEYIDACGSVANLNILRICDVGDGGCKADKFERDIRLLKLDLEDNPKNYRALYYLGASYEALGQNKEAIEMYTRRADFPESWDEEAWMAHYRRGIVKEVSGDQDGAIKDYTDAWARRPWRTEPLAKLAQLMLKQNQHQKACAIAKAGVVMPYPDGDFLFIERNCYNDEFHQIIGIADFYAGKKYDGAKHCDHLILNGSKYCHNALQNASWYMEPIKSSKIINLGQIFSDVIPSGYKACNPSIASSIINTNNYIIGLRTVNYSINNDGSYNYPGYVHTRTLRCELDNKLERISAFELDNPPGRNDAHIRGIEDVRIYRVSGNMTYGLGTRLDGPEDHPQIYACDWKWQHLIRCDRISDPSKTEKNWLPIMNGSTHIVPDILYSTGQELICQRGLDVTYRSRVPIHAADFRGGSNVIPYLDGWLWVIHQVTTLPGQTKRKYLHRLCWSNDRDGSFTMGPSTKGLRISLPFCFEKPQIEFCSGAAVGNRGELLLTYGIEDNDAYIAVVEESTVCNMLQL